MLQCDACVICDFFVEQFIIICILLVIIFILLLKNNKSKSDIDSQCIGEIKEKIETIKDQINETKENIIKETNESNQKFVQSIFATSQTSGTWGEWQLKRVLEIAGMQEGTDYDVEEVYENKSIKASTKTQKPDVTIKLPGNRKVFVDAKTVAIDEENGVDIESIKDRISDLAKKKYHENTEESPDFVILFLPTEGYMHEIVKKDKKIIEDAVKDNIIIATPITLIAILRSIGYSWQQENLAQKSMEIQKMCNQLLSLIPEFGKWVKKIGTTINNANKEYKKFQVFVNEQMDGQIKEMKEVLSDKNRNNTKQENSEKVLPSDDVENDT